MADTKTLLLENRFYHIYTHAVGSELFFKSDRNYQYLLTLLQKYLNGYMDIYAYCLMPNHIHLLIQVLENKEFNNEKTLSKKISQRFSHCFNSYAQAYNKENHRRGSLFVNRFKRKWVETEQYLKQLILYLHSNPVEAGLVEKPDQWDYSSYNEIIKSKPILVQNTSEVIRYFDDLKNFIACHR